jgi:RNA polymerase sigma-70 factor (ECF subfamily)
VKGKAETIVEAGQLSLIQHARGTSDYASEAELLAACRRQEIYAFEVLYHQHGARLKSVAYHIVRNRQDAEDAVQETFLKAHRSIKGFEGRSSLATWLCRIVVNICYDIARKRRREAELSIEPDGRQSSPSLRMALDDAIRRINPKMRMVFLLFEVEGFQHSEISSILDIAEGTSKAWLFEARKELRRLLTEARR